jgi:hypothetical protein
MVGQHKSERWVNMVRNLQNNKINTTTDKKGNKSLQLSNYEANLTYLFAYSIFFRTSIVDFCDYSIEAKIIEEIRKLLLSVLAN